MCQFIFVNVVCVAEEFCVVGSRSHYLRQNPSSGFSLPSTRGAGVSQHTPFIYIPSLAVSALHGYNRSICYLALYIECFNLLSRVSLILTLAISEKHIHLPRGSLKYAYILCILFINPLPCHHHGLGSATYCQQMEYAGRGIYDC